jgi:hypothetical protein
MVSGELVADLPNVRFVRIADDDEPKLLRDA